MLQIRFRSCDQEPIPKNCDRTSVHLSYLGALIRERSEMIEMKQRFGCRVGIFGLMLAALCLALAPAFAQNSLPGLEEPTQGGKAAKPPGKVVGGFDKVEALPPGGPAPAFRTGMWTSPDATIPTAPEGCWKALILSIQACSGNTIARRRLKSIRSSNLGWRQNTRARSPTEFAIRRALQAR